VYACTLRIAGKRIDERLANENVSGCDARTGQAGGGLGMLPILPCAFRNEAIRQWAGLGRDRSLCAVICAGAYPVSLTRFLC
jgi:hypothetical protein